MNIIVGQNESLPNIRYEKERSTISFPNDKYTAPKGALQETEINDWGRGTSGQAGTLRETKNVFNAQKTYDPTTKTTINNTAYRDPINGKPIEVKTRNFTYKNWIRKF